MNGNMTQQYLKEKLSTFLRMRRTGLRDNLGIGSPSSTTSGYRRTTMKDFFVGAVILADLLIEEMRNKKGQDKKRCKGVYYGTNPCIQKNIFVKFRELDSLLALDEHGITESLSLNGFTAHVDFVDKPSAINQLIEISLKWPYKQSDPVRAIGCVEWIKKKDDDITYEIGVRFIHMSDEDSDQYIVYFSDEVDAESKAENSNILSSPKYE